MRVENIKQYTKNFSVIHNKIYENSEMSYRTKGLFSDLWHLPNNWSFNEREIAQRSTDGLTSITSGIKSLEKHGYLQIVKKSNGKTLWILSDRGEALEFAKKNFPKPTKLPHHDNQDKATHPNLDKPYLDNPDQAHRHLLNTHQTKQVSLQNTKKLHVRSSKFKSKNSNETHDDSLASNKVQSKVGLTMINSKKAGAQAHLARRSSSKHTSRFSNSKYKTIDSLLHDAFSNFDDLVTRKSYERKCISSWLNGNRRLGTPSFSMTEIETAIEKAKKYNQQSSRPVLGPLALVYNILQTSRTEASNAKANQKKYQNKKSKSNNTSSKSSNSSSSSSDSDPTEAAEVKDLSNGSGNEDSVYSQTIFSTIHTTLIPYFEKVIDNDSYDKASKEFVELQDYIKKYVKTVETFSYASEQFKKFSLPKCEKQKKNPVKVIEKLCVKN